MPLLARPDLQGVRLTMSVRGDRGLVANFHATDAAIFEDILLVNLAHGPFVQSEAQRFAPVDTGFMRDHIQLEYSAEGLVFEVGYDDADFAAAGLPPYYLWQELGFHHYRTGAFIRNAHLEPAFQADQTEYARDVRAAVQRAVARTANRNRDAR